MQPGDDIIAILLLPLTGFVVLGLFGRRYIGRFSGMIATILILLGALLALSVAWDHRLSNRETPYFLYKVLHFTWLSFGPDFSIDMNFLVDPLSLMMTVVVTLVSLMVHLFSLGYMKGETRYPT